MRRKLLGFCFVVLMFSSLVLVVLAGTSRAATATWSVQVADSGAYVGAYTSIALDSYGNPHISYQGASGSNSTLKYASWNGNSWKFETVDSSDYKEGSWTSLVLDSKGYAHISYNEDRMSQLKYAYWNGTGWTIQDVDSPGNAGNYNSLALDLHGNPCIAYHRGGQGLEGSLKYAHWTGSEWKIETVDPGAEGANPLNAGQCCSLALDSADNPHISYISGGGGLEYASWTGSSWDLKTVAVGGSGVYSQLVYGPRLLALDSQGNPHIVYNVHNWGSSSENVTNRPWYVSWTGSAWTTEQIDSKAQMCYAENIALDPSGNPYVVYSDMRTDPTNWSHTVNHLEFATKTNSGWSVQEVDSSCADYPSIALDSGGNPHISYCDNIANFRMKYAVLAESYQVGFSQTGLSGFDGNVLTIDSGSLKAANLPLTFTWNKGTNHIYSFTTSLNVDQADRCVWTGTFGLSAARGGTLSLSSSGNVSAQYQLQHQVSFSAKPAAAGSVTPSTATWVAEDAAPLALSAAANSGYKFQSWSTDESGKITFADSAANETTAIAKSSGTITANFVSTSSSNASPTSPSSPAPTSSIDVPGMPNNAVQLNRTDLIPTGQTEQVASGQTYVYRYSNFILMIDSSANCELNVTVNPMTPSWVLSVNVEPNENLGLKLNVTNTQPEGAAPVQNSLNFYVTLDPNATGQVTAKLGLFINQTQLSSELGRQVEPVGLTWMYWDATQNSWVPVQSQLDPNGYLVCSTSHLSIWTVAEAASSLPSASQKPNQTGTAPLSFFIAIAFIVALVVVVVGVVTVLRRKRKS